MKPLALSIALFFFLCTSTLGVYGQKEMMLEESLVKSTTSLVAKRKGIGMVGKYKFGPYQIVSGKAGLTTTSGKSSFLGAQTESKSKKKLSFVFVKDGKDSVLANVSIHTNATDWDSDQLPILMTSNWAISTSHPGWSMSSLKESKETFMVLFSFPSDTITWRMILFSEIGEAVKGEGQFEGMLTDGVTGIQIKEIKQWNDGKNAMMGVATGYEFYWQGKAIAAVQSSLDTFQKKLVWIREDNDSKLQLILAATSAAIMVKTDNDLAAIDGVH